MCKTFFREVFHFCHIPNLSSFPATIKICTCKACVYQSFKGPGPLNVKSSIAAMLLHIGYSCTGTYGYKIYVSSSIGAPCMYLQPLYVHLCIFLARVSRHAFGHCYIGLMLVTNVFLQILAIRIRPPAEGTRVHMVRVPRQHVSVTHGILEEPLPADQTWEVFQLHVHLPNVSTHRLRRAETTAAVLTFFPASGAMRCQLQQVTDQCQ